MDIHLFAETPRHKPYIPMSPDNKGRIRNEVWTLVVWDPNVKKYVPDNGPQATLRFTGYTDHIDPAPPVYRGRLPSPEAIRFIAGLQRDHEEYQARRADMLAGDL